MAYRIKSKPTKPALPEVIQNLAQELEWTLEEIGRLWATKENAFQKQMNQTTYNLYAQVRHARREELWWLGGRTRYMMITWWW